MADDWRDEEPSTLREERTGSKSFCNDGLDALPINIEEKYNELIMAVAQKFPGETRHETALRYIKQRESSCGEACSEASI